MQRTGDNCNCPSCAKGTRQRVEVVKVEFRSSIGSLSYSGQDFRMMLQHPALGLGPSEMSASALVPCLSPPGSLTLEDFTHFSPFIKDELRHAIHNKRLSNGMSTVTSDYGSSSSERPAELTVVKKELTSEELDRRKRRRERNKIAAAKCRNKKKEKTDCLQKESEKLESINAELKAQIEELKNQKQQLVYMLNLHRPTCIVRAQNGQTPEDERNLFIQQIREGAFQGLNLSTTAPVQSVLPTTCSHL